jgi:hypothetical protein
VNGVLPTRSWIYYEIKRGDAPPLSNQAADIGDELAGAVVPEELLKKVPGSPCHWNTQKSSKIFESPRILSDY